MNNNCKYETKLDFLLNNWKKAINSINTDI